MAEIPVSDVRAAFADILNRVAYGKERILVTRHDHGVAALIPMEDLRRLEDLDQTAKAETAAPPAESVEPSPEAPPEEPLSAIAQLPEPASTDAGGETVPDHILERIREEIYDRARREVYEQVHEEASRKLAAMVRPRSPR